MKTLEEMNILISKLRNFSAAGRIRVHFSFEVKGPEIRLGFLRNHSAGFVCARNQTQRSRHFLLRPDFDRNKIYGRLTTKQKTENVFNYFFILKLT